jgi:hypothetical protein
MCRASEMYSILHYFVIFTEMVRFHLGVADAYCFGNKKEIRGYMLTSFISSLSMSASNP